MPLVHRPADVVTGVPPPSRSRWWRSSGHGLGPLAGGRRPALDWVGSQVARRTGTTSAFGARFDMETDAFLIAVLAATPRRPTAGGSWDRRRALPLARRARPALAASAGAAAPLAQGRRRRPGIVLAAAVGTGPRRAHRGVARGRPRARCWRSRSAATCGGCGGPGGPSTPTVPTRPGRDHRLGRRGLAALPCRSSRGPAPAPGRRPAGARRRVAAVAPPGGDRGDPRRAGRGGRARRPRRRLPDLPDRPFDPTTDWVCLGPGWACWRLDRRAGRAGDGGRCRAGRAGRAGRGPAGDRPGRRHGGPAPACRPRLGVVLVPAGLARVGPPTPPRWRTTRWRRSADLADRRTFGREIAADPMPTPRPPGCCAVCRARTSSWSSWSPTAASRCRTRPSPGVDAVLDDGSRRLRRAGWQARSAFLTSPTFGAASWLAHSTLQSGLWVDSQRRYEQLLGSDRLTLTSAFADAGWRTVRRPREHAGLA